MIKICLFVEGSGEAIFITKLARHILREHNAKIVTFQLIGGRRKTFPRMEMERREWSLGSGDNIYVQIVNSANEDRVVSDACDRAQNLADEEFEQIILVRDVAPNFTRHEINRLRNGIEAILEPLPIPAVALLEIMEFEAWLLAMCDHYEGVDASLTADAITGVVGRMPNADNCHEFDSPGEVHGQILAIAGIDDAKSNGTVECVVDAFDLDLLVDERAASIDDLNSLIASIRATTEAAE